MQTKLPEWFTDKQMDLAQALRQRLDKAGVGRGQTTGKPLQEFVGLVSAIVDGDSVRISAERDLAITRLLEGATIMGQAAVDGGASARAFRAAAERFRTVTDRSTFLAATADYDEVMFLMMREAVSSMRMAERIKADLGT